MRRALAGGLAALVLVLTGCGPHSAAPPGAARVDVDTPRLEQLKAQAGVADCAPGPAAHVDGGLPAVTLPCLGGGPDVDLSSLKGPLVVNLWASWCTPCRKELPFYERFHQQYADQVHVLGIDYQDVQPEAALRLVRDTGVTYPLLADPQSSLDGAAPFPHLAGLPFLALVDAHGKVVHREFVEITSEQQLVDLVDTYLGTHL